MKTPWTDRLKRRSVFDRERLLDRLDALEFHRTEEDERLYAEASLPGTALQLAEVDQASEYRLCRDVAEHLTGTIPDPGEIPD